MRDRIKLYTFPDVPKDGIANDEMVLKVTPWGSFTDLPSIDLVDGDVYSLRVKKRLPPRTRAQLFSYIADNMLQLEWERDLDFEFSDLEVWKGTTLLVRYPKHIDLQTTLSDAINYVMDMDEEEL